MERAVFMLLILYLGIINAAGFCMMGADKRRARRGKWRIREASLFLAAWIGGSAGCWLPSRRCVPPGTARPWSGCAGTQSCCGSGGENSVAIFSMT